MAGICTVPMSRFKVGDDVQRPVNVFARRSPMRLGIVTRVYSERSLGFLYEELYEVTWDTEGGKPIEPLVCVGYLPHGIDPTARFRDESEREAPDVPVAPTDDSIGPSACKDDA